MVHKLRIADRTSVMEFEAHARQQAQATLDALASQLRESPAFERLVQELSNAARDEADTLAGRVRLEAEQRAEAERVAARAAAQAQADAAQAVNAALLTNLDEVRRQLQEAQASAQIEIAHARLEFEARETGLEQALQSLYTAANARELFEALLEHLARRFGKAALFFVGTTGLKGWKARGFGATTNISELAIPPAIESLLARVLTDRAPIRLSDDAPIGLLNGPIAHAMAMPIVAHDRVKAVAYIEGAEAPSPAVPGGYKLAEMLVAHTSRRLASKAPTQGLEQPGTSPESGQNPGTYARPRQAPRVKMQDVINVTLDGSASFLVDLSAVGAQVLSPTALHPNGVVRMTLLSGGKTLTCKGRVIWSSLEQLRGTAAGLCRAGLQFTEADPQLLDAFLGSQGIAMDGAGDLPGLRLLKGTA